MRALPRPHDDGLDADAGYGTRWRVVAAAVAPALALSAAVATAIGTGALAVSFVAQSSTLTLSTDGLQGDDLGITVVDVPTSGVPGGRSWNVRIGVGTGRINGLCLSQRVGVLGVPFTLVFKGGDADPSTNEISADGLVIDLEQAKGVISALGDLQVNKNGADVVLGSTGIPLAGSADRFGLQAANADLRRISATVRSIDVPNLLHVPRFSVSVQPGDHPCPPPGTGTGPGS